MVKEKDGSPIPWLKWYAWFEHWIVRIGFLLVVKGYVKRLQNGEYMRPVIVSSASTNNNRPSSIYPPTFLPFFFIGSLGVCLCATLYLFSSPINRAPWKWVIYSYTKYISLTLSKLKLLLNISLSIPFLISLSLSHAHNSYRGFVQDFEFLSRMGV